MANSGTSVRAETTELSGSDLRRQRLAAGVSYRAVAHALAVSTSRVVAIERTARPTRDVTLRFLQAIADATRIRAFRNGLAAGSNSDLES